MRIGVISDTHGLVRPEAIEQLRGSDLILHAGDIGSQDVVDELEQLAPVTAIRGNIDTASWARQYPPQARLLVDDVRIYMLHDLKELDFEPAAEGYAVVISGHSHKPKISQQAGVLYLNPGSAGRRRFKLPVCLATLMISGGSATAELHDLLPQ